LEIIFCENSRNFEGGFKVKKRPIQIISFVLTFLMLISIPTVGMASTSISNTDNEISANVTQIVTHESAMPILTNSIGASLYSYSSTNTLQTPSRAAWVAATSNELERAYGQKVLRVEEEVDVIRFIFETADCLPTGEYVNQDGIPCTPQQLLMTEYLKPESASTMIQTSPSRALSTKINYYYSWSSYYPLQSKSATSLNAAYNVSILIASAIVSPLSSVVLGVANWIGQSISASQPVSARTEVKYYYQTKAGCVLVNGTWTSTVQVGCRKGFGYWVATFTNSYGEPIRDKPRDNQADYSPNPSNQDTVEYKANFNNNTWIHNKAIECYNSGVPYVDIYGIASKPIP
jgi:hypothetical protein